MSKFYVTYGLGSNLRGCYSTVEADSWGEARKRMMEVTGGKFAFDYSEEDFNDCIKHYGLTEVPLQPQVYSEEWPMTAQTKMCPACKIDKPRSDYHISGSGKLLSRCILCHTEKVQKSRTKVDSQKSKEINDAYAKKERMNQAERKNRLMQHYGGGRCFKCGVSDVDVLTLDHINNDGSRHRAELAGNRKVKSIGSSAVYKRIEKDGYPPIFQVLCFNCNIKKHLVQLREKFND